MPNIALLPKHLTSQNTASRFLRLHCDCFLGFISPHSLALGITVQYQYRMYTPLHSLVSTFILASLTDAKTVLDRQCWHQLPLSTAHVSSSPDRRYEYASPIQDQFQSISDSYAPWTHPPKCTPILTSINDKLCVYTSTTFANGRGISIFTTPNIAKEYASLPAFTSLSALDNQKINVPTNTWRAASLPSKGIGMLATTPLKFSDRITSYTPAFLALLESELNTWDRETFWRLGIDQLPRATREEFLSLATVFGDERFRVQDIVQANTFQVVVGGGNHLAVWPETSRLNHACNPKYVFACLVAGEIVGLVGLLSVNRGANKCVVRSM